MVQKNIWNNKMIGYSYIIKNPLPFRYKSIEPIKMLDNDIIAMQENVMIYTTRASALEDLNDELDKYSLSEIIKEFRELKPLKWKDATLWTYTQSIFARVAFYPVMTIVFPIIKFGIKYNLKKSQTKNPEWWI